MTRLKRDELSWRQARPFVASGTILIGFIVAALAASPLFATSHRQALVPTNGNHGMNARIVACQQAGRKVCNPAAAAARSFPLSKRDPARSSLRASGTAFLTRAQVLTQLGWSTAPAGSIGASLMTYGQAQKIAPGLAAESSVVVNPSREVWVVTRYYSTPVAVKGVDGRPGGSDTMQLSSASVVIDALTGMASDSCGNCAVVPANQ